MLLFDSPPSPYRRISDAASSNNNNRYISNYFHSVKKPILNIFLSLILILLLLIIVIKTYLSTKINNKQEDHDHSSIIHHILSATETIDNELPCPISINNASWNNKQGVIIVNQLGLCGSSSYELCHPNDLFIDHIHQNLYVVDTDNNRIQKYSLNEQIDHKQGLNGITVASQGLMSPKSISVDTISEDMYILDCGLTNLTNPLQPTNYRVQLWRKNSNVGQILINETGFYKPDGYSHIILDKQMNIYIETENYLRKWFSSMDYTRDIVIIGGGIAKSRGLYIDDNLTMYIIDQYDKTIKKWFSNFVSPIIIKSDLKTAIGLILDCNQFIYYGDLSENIIYQLNPITNEKRIVLDLNRQQLSGQFGFPPLKMKFDKFYNMFVIDNKYSRITKYSIL